MLCHGSLGGSSRVATRLARALQDRGHHISLVSATPPPVAEAELSAVRLEALTRWRGGRPPTLVESMWEPWRLAALERRVEDIVRRDGVDVVHYHYAWPFALIVGRLRDRLGSAAPAFVGTLHGTDVTHAPGAEAPGALADTDLLTTVSRAYAELARRRLRLARSPFVIPNFVAPADFRPSVDFANVGTAARRPRLVHVSNFRDVKNPDGVARVFAAVRRLLPAELWLVGAGPGLARIETLLRAAGVRDDVRVLGYRNDVAGVLARCDLLLMTSLEESFCLAALEALACGLCVVAPSVGGLPEVAPDREAGLLFSPGDDEHAAELVLRLLTEPALRLPMRERAVRRARSFSRESVVSRYESLYRLAVSSAAVAQVALAHEAV
jgi:L-malate glycosyltransferase